MSTRKFQNEMFNTQVLVLAGGKAKRMGIDVPKCLLDVAGKKLIDRCIESLTSNGFRQFVFLLGYKHEIVMEHIGDGNKYGIEVKYSIDPDSKTGLGKGKAVKHALKCEKIDKRKRCIVVFPDDLILDDKVYSRFLTTHLEVVRKNNALASAIFVPGIIYPYGVAKVNGTGMILQLTEKPYIKKPTSVGIYAFEPEVYGIIEKTIDLEDPNPVELESCILPLLAKEHKFWAFFIPSSKWLPINTLKEYEQAIKVMTVG